MSNIEKTEMNYDKKRPKAENAVKIMDVTFRDGHQSLFTTLGRTEDMVPVAEKMDEVGFWAIETWGGNTFGAMHAYLNEDPWERIRVLKKRIRKTPISMLLRGQSLVAYRNYADDVVTAFVERAAENGINIFRTFDALNDYRNFETAVKAIKKTGQHFQGCICYSMTEQRMGGDVYNIDYYVKKTKELVDYGADSICIKDMAGMIAPYDAYDLIKAVKNVTDVPVAFHTHFTSGMASMAHLKAVEAGVDILDTCMSPYAYRNSHPAIEPLVMSLLGTNRDTGFNIDDLAGINDTLEKDILPKYKRLLNDDKLSIIDINVPLFQSPSGLFANIESQLEDMGELDRLGEVYAELAKVRRDLGEIPLVTPTNRIVAIQTVNNVLFDEGKDEYSIISAQVKDLCYGLYGETAAPINAKLIKKALKGYSKGSKPITCRPAEMIKPELPQVKEEVKGLAVDIEDELIYALFPVSGKRFLKWKYGKEEPPATVNPITIEEALKEEELIKKARAGELVDPDSINKGPERSEHSRAFGVYVENEYFEIEVDEVGGPPVVTYSSGPLDQVPSDTVVQIPAGQGVVPAPPKAATPPPVQAPVAPVAQTQTTTPTTPAQPSSSDGTALSAPMPGMIVDYKAKVGDSVSKGDILVILEAMKMENALPSPVSGTVKAINFASGDSVAKDAALCIIE